MGGSGQPSGPGAVRPGSVAVTGRPGKVEWTTERNWICNQYLMKSGTVQEPGTINGRHRRGRKDIIPMGIADMEFATARPVIEAVRRRMEHPLFGYFNLDNRFMRQS